MVTDIYDLQMVLTTLTKNAYTMLVLGTHSGRVVVSKESYKIAAPLKKHNVIGLKRQTHLNFSKHIGKR